MWHFIWAFTFLGVTSILSVNDREKINQRILIVEKIGANTMKKSLKIDVKIKTTLTINKIKKK